MPSPVGHALAGLIVAWTSDLTDSVIPRGVRSSWSWFHKAGGWLAFCCALLAAMADADLMFGAHRAVAHSVTAVAAVAAAAWLVARVRHRPAGRLAAICGAAYATHLLLDWMATDPNFPYGIQVLWPLSHHWFISGWNVFPGTERRRLLSMPTIVTNAKAAAVEVAILGPVAACIWLVREKALARFAAQMPGGDHPPQ